MGATAFYLLTLQKYIDSNKWFWNKKSIPFVYESIQRVSQLITWKKTGLTVYMYEFSVDYTVIDTSNIIINIQWRNII